MIQLRQLGFRLREILNLLYPANLLERKIAGFSAEKNRFWLPLGGSDQNVEEECLTYINHQNKRNKFPRRYSSASSKTTTLALFSKFVMFQAGVFSKSPYRPKRWQFWSRCGLSGPFQICPSEYNTKTLPVPNHADSRSKRVDSFVKTFLKPNGIAFNAVMDRWILNLAGWYLDCVGPLSQFGKMPFLLMKRLSWILPWSPIWFVEQ